MVVVALVGATLTLTVTGAETLTVARALLVASATLVAATVAVTAVNGAVYRPVVEMLPPPLATVQVTAVLVVPLTAAVNCCDAPVVSEVLVGATEIETSVGVATTVNVIAFEYLPVLESQIATRAVPAFATALAGTTAVARQLLTKVVASFAPFQVTASERLKFEPEIFRVKLCAPAATAVGEIAFK